MPKQEAPWIVVTGLDGSGKTTLVERLAAELSAFSFRLPHNDFVHSSLQVSGDGKPLVDPHTDALIHAADARLANYSIRKWRQQHNFLISQRGWPDHYVFNAVGSIDYAATNTILRTEDLEKPTFCIYLVAHPGIAWDRIKDSIKKDKYETPIFLQKQYVETIRVYDQLKSNPELNSINVPSFLINTTTLNKNEVFIWAREAYFLHLEGSTSLL